MTDDQRIAIGLIETGLFVPASRQAARAVIVKAAEAHLEKIGDEVAVLREDLRTELLSKLSNDEKVAVLTE